MLAEIHIPSLFSLPEMHMPTLDDSPNHSQKPYALATAYVLGLFVLALVLSQSSTPVCAQGLIVPGAGPVNRSMGGASTAAPLDAAGALYWNPAAISGLKRNEMMFGAELVYADAHIASSAGGSSGVTRSDSGLSTLAMMAMVHHVENSPWTLGMGVFSLAGASINYPGTADNPILDATGPGGNVSLGPEYASVGALALMPTLSRQVNDRLAVGFGPVVGSMLVSLDPAFFATPDDANGDGVLSFPPATNARPFWGAGFRMGMLYEVNRCWDAGFSFTSPQWFETWEFNSQDELAAPRTVRVQATLPTILSWGLAYKGIEKTLVATDIRYFDYENADLFGDLLGWESIFAFAVGVQRQITPSTSVRIGYSFNENPIPSTKTLFNIQVPGIAQHVFSVGGTCALTKHMDMSVAYVHTFKNSIAQSAVNEVAGPAVGFDLESDSLAFALTVKFGS